jgi:hypothetical protein
VLGVVEFDGGGDVGAQRGGGGDVEGGEEPFAGREIGAVEHAGQHGGVEPAQVLGDESSQLRPSGVRSIAMSQRTPSSPVHWPAKRPSTSALPSSSIPSSTKNAMAASMSSTTMPTLSIR